MDKRKKIDLWDVIAFGAFILMSMCMIIVDKYHIDYYGNYRFVFIIRDICLFLTIGILLFRGIYGLRNNIIAREHFQRLIVGALLTILLLSNLIFTLHLLNKNELLANDLNTAKNKLISLLQSDTISITKKAALSKILSQQTFFLSGSITEYFDSLGNKYKYVPTNKEIRGKDQYLQAYNLHHLSIISLKKSIVFLTVVSSLTIVTGLVWPIHRKKDP